MFLSLMQMLLSPEQVALAVGKAPSALTLLNILGTLISVLETFYEQRSNLVLRMGTHFIYFVFITFSCFWNSDYIFSYVLCWLWPMGCARYSEGEPENFCGGINQILQHFREQWSWTLGGIK